MKNLVIIFTLFLCFEAKGQSAEVEFHAVANTYIKGNFQQAKIQLAEAIKKYPNDPKLNSLAQKLKKEEQQQEQDKNKEEQNNKEDSKEKKDGSEGEDKQEKQDEQQASEQEQAEEKKKNGDPKERSEGQESAESDDKKNNEQNELSTQKKLQEMNMSEEKAKMILEAMKNSEKQYLQQNKRKPTKPTNSNRPDW